MISGKRVAKFEKVSFDQFYSDWKANNDKAVWYEEDVATIYDGIKLPMRSTAGSAGYDFYLPDRVEIYPHESVVIPTGIKCCMMDNFVLMLYPRSSLGFKYGISLANMIAVVDSDYYNNESNEGHIMVKLTNNSDKICVIEGKFVQGIFMEYGITVDDNAEEKRTGGIGSTGK